MPKLILIHGPMACGKTTLTQKLRQKYPKYTYVDRPNIKRALKHLGREQALKKSKEIAYKQIKNLMKSGKNIIAEEINPENLTKKLTIPKQYKLKAYYITCSLKEAIKRDKQRTKKTRTKLVKQIHKEYKKPTTETIIDTQKLTIKQALNKIITQIKQSQ